MNNKVKLNPNCLVRPQYRSYSQYIKELEKRLLNPLSTEERKQYDEEQKQYDEIWNRHANDDF